MTLLSDSNAIQTKLDVYERRAGCGIVVEFPAPDKSDSA